MYHGVKFKLYGWVWATIRWVILAGLSVRLAGNKSIGSHWRFRTSLRRQICYSYHKLLPPPVEGALCFGMPVIFPGFLVLLCLQVVVFLFWFLCFPSSFFSSVCRIPCGRGHNSLFHVFSSSFFSSNFSSIFCFFFCFLSFLYFIEYVCRVYRIQYDDMPLHCPLCLLRTGNVVSLWRSLVTT